MKSNRSCTVGIAVGIIVLCLFSVAIADDFGTGANQFTIDFVTISGNAGSANGTPIGEKGDNPNYAVFEDPRTDYRMAIYETTNDQWDKFTASLGVPVTGDPWNAYSADPVYTGTSCPPIWPASACVSATVSDRNQGALPKDSSPSSSSPSK